MAQFASDELKILSISAPVWLKMLRDREQKVFNKIYGKFKNGETTFLTEVAEFSVIRDQINEIVNALNTKQGE